ncbi:MAG TPA: DUF2085 domain-containing protein [candidate division Zixibacteria bacterium]|nr:DUF2085 domain-containing protein [candidate division Zixibacteria bacterium]
MAAERKPVTGKRRSMVIGIDRGVYWLSKHWLAVFNTLALIYVGLPILAPALMNAGLETPARVIYRIYSPLCHQMTQRSFFLFGDQYAYPRAIAGTELTPIETYVGDIPEFDNVDPDDWPAFFTAARRYLGDEQLGYKIALCQRDIGIYLFVLVGGLLYAMLRNRINIKPLPILLFVVIGLAPIAIDGFSQLFSYWSTPLDGSDPTGLAATIQSIIPLRESTPMMRALTGAWFGLALVWLAYPHVNESMKGTERELGAKLRRLDNPELASAQQEAAVEKPDSSRPDS